MDLFILRPILLFALFPIAFFINITIHEFGHMVFGLLTGYKFGFVRVFSFVLSKNNGGFKLSRVKFVKGNSAGLCSMIPKSPDIADFRFVLFYLGGAIANMLVMVILLSLHISTTFNLRSNMFLFIFFICNLCTAINTLIPLKCPSYNDGMYLYLALKSQDERKAIFHLLRTHEELRNGKRFADFSSGAFVLSESSGHGNYLLCAMVYYDGFRLYDMKEYSESLKQYERVFAVKSTAGTRPYRTAALLSMIYIHTVHIPDFDKAQRLYSKYAEMKDEHYAEPSLSSRILSAYEYFVNGNKNKGKELLEKAKQEAEKLTNIGLKKMECEYLEILEAKYS